MIAHSKPWITCRDINSVHSILESGMLAQGEGTRKFELTLSAWVGGADGIGVGSGAAAISLALLALCITKGDEVVLPSYVCPSVLEAVLTVGATPVLCDVGHGWVVTPENMEESISKKTKALIIPHMYGIFAEVEKFKDFGIPVIEDCAQAIGRQGTRKLCSDIATFSFHPTKCITTGEGGMAVSSNRDLINRMRSIRDGNHYELAARLFSPLSDINAVLGLSQLDRFNENLEMRKQIAKKYIAALQSISPRLINESDYKDSMFFRFVFRISKGLDKYQDRFAEKGVYIRRGVDKLLHRLLGMSDNNYQVSIQLFEETISLPIYPGLEPEEMDVCLNAIEEIFIKY